MSSHPKADQGNTGEIGAQKSASGHSAGKNVRERLQELDVRPSKRRGQNFLLNNTIAQNIVDAGGFPSEARVVEIGPGLGALTNHLVQIYKNFSVIEIEESFCRGLAETFPDLAVTNADVLDVSFKDFGDDLYVISNLPYSISTDVLLKLIYERSVIHRAVILLQREFAERFAAAPGSKQFGSLSVLGQLNFEASLGAVYQGGSFFPPADVESRVLILKRKADAPTKEEVEKVEKILRATFGQRRKQIIGSLSGNLDIPKALILEVLQKVNLTGTERPEELPIQIFLYLATVLL